jgi:hypothetical protein
VIPASAVALVLNVRAGLEISVEAAVIYGLADVALVTVALVASVCGHVTISRAAIAACALLSLVSQINAHMSNAGHAMRMAGEQNQALARALTKVEKAKDEANTARNNAAIARTHAETARQQASEITERGTVTDLEAASARASRKVDGALKAAAKAKKACRDAPECLAAQDASTAAKTAVAQAHSKAAQFTQAASEETRARQFDEDARRADAKAEKAEASRAGIGGPAKSDGTVSFLAQTYGWDEAATGRWVSAGKTGLLLTATLLLQMLGGYAGQAISDGWAARRTAKAALETPQIEPAATVAVEPEAEPTVTYLDACDRPVTRPVAYILEDTLNEMMSEYMEFGMIAEEMSDTTGATLAVASEPEASATGTEIAVATPPGPKGGKPAVKPKAKKKTAPKAIKTPPTASAATVIRFRSRPGVEVAKRSKTLNEALAKQYGVA